MHWDDTTPEHLKGYLIPYEGFQRFWLDAGLSFNTVGLLTRDSLTENLRKAVRKRYADLHKSWFWDRSTKYRSLDKTPAYILMADAIDAVFPDSYHIFCIRDPRAVLNSLLRIYRFRERADVGRGRIDEIGFWGVVPPGYEAHRHKPLVKRLSWQIQALYEIGFANQNHLRNRLILFRYEWLLHHSHKSIINLFQELELSPWPEITKLIPNTFTDYSPPWPQPGEPLQEPYGKIRCYRDDEIDQLVDVEMLAVQLGYRPFNPGILADGNQEFEL